MEGDEREAVFEDTFRLAPLRDIVSFHMVMILATSVLFLRFPNNLPLQVISPAIALAQWILLLIWLNLCGEKSLRRMVAVGTYAALTLLVNTRAAWTSSGILSIFVMIVGVVFWGEMISLPLIFARMEGLRVKRLISGVLPPADPLQFRLSRLVWMTALAAALFGLVQVRVPGAEASLAAKAIAGVVVFSVGCTMVVNWSRVCIWIALKPGPVTPRLAVAGYLWLLGGLLMIHGLNADALGALGTAVCFGAATIVVVTTLVRARGIGYYAVWEKEAGGRETAVIGHALTSSSKPAEAELLERDGLTSK